MNEIETKIKKVTITDPKDDQEVQEDLENPDDKENQEICKDIVYGAELNLVSERTDENKEKQLKNLEPDKLSKRLKLAWNFYESRKIFKKVEGKDALMLPQVPKHKKLRVVCISDTHSHHNALKIPDGDILIHAGDFTYRGNLTELKNFNEFLGRLPHKHKIVIPGNHELTLDEESEHEFKIICKELRKSGIKHPRDVINNAKLLIDEEITISGIKIYGSPWQPTFCSWAFNLDRGEEILERWKQIPVDTDILITHGPPFGHGDITKYKHHVGCLDLLSVVEIVKPKFHIFGHIHEDYGITTDNEVVFINASSCNLRYSPVNSPVIFEIMK